jgi:hypothetical protein
MGTLDIRNDNGAQLENNCLVVLHIYTAMLALLFVSAGLIRDRY